MKRYLTTIVLIATTLLCAAQQLTYQQYISSVTKNNTALIAQRMDIEIAQASVKSSKVYNDPTLSVEYGNNEDWETELGQSFAAQLSRTFTFGVRRAGIRLAEKELEAATAVFNNYARNLYADATTAYLQHLRAKALLATAAQRDTFMTELAHSDSLRFQRGEISKTVWLETRLAAGLVHNQRLEAETEYKNTKYALGYYTGNYDGIEQTTVEGTLGTIESILQPVDYYIEQAFTNRSDLAAATSNVEIAQAEKKLNSARRRIDLQLSIGAEYNDADPQFTKLKVGAAIPIKFSNLNNGARIREQAVVEKRQQELLDTRLQIQNEVMQAYNECKTAQRQVENFENSMVNETAELLYSKRKAYRMGEISFIEFIETERSDNIMNEEYINALFNRAASLVELQRCTGITKTEE